MSISASTSRAVFVGNGVTRSFPFSFRVWDKNQIRASCRDTDRNMYSLRFGADYTLVLGEQGGRIDLAEPLPAGHRLALTRDMPFVQEDRYISGTRFDPHEIEDALDIACAERQQIKEALDRALQVNPADSRSPAEYMEEFSRAMERAAAAEAAAAAMLNRTEARLAALERRTAALEEARTCA